MSNIFEIEKERVMAKQNTDHVVIGANSLQCLHCGEDYKLPLDGGGVSINMMLGMSKGFTEDHKSCKPSEAGKARFEYKTLHDWARSWDTGMSSMALWHILTGQYPTRPYSSDLGRTPSDPSDFGRCYRLLKLVPPETAKDALRRAAEKWPHWAKLVEAWDELTAMYEDALARKVEQATEMYQRMKSLGL